MTYDDMILFAVLSCVAAAIISACVYFNIYKGVYGSLAGARIGDVYNFRYIQPVTGAYERYLAKVVSVAKLPDWEISRLNNESKYRRYDHTFERTKTLVTCVMNDGSFRQFYGERCDDVRRTMLGGLLFKVGVAHLF
jgi:hypothetical protein